jgi:hypothetical protein
LNVCIECKSGVIFDLLHDDVREVSQKYNIKDLKEFVQKTFDKDNCFFSKIIVDGIDCSTLNIEEDIAVLRKTVECENEQPLEVLIRNATLHTGKSWIDGLLGIDLLRKAMRRIDELDDLSTDLKMMEAFYQGLVIGSRQQANVELIHDRGGFSTPIVDLQIELDGQSYSIDQINDDIKVLNQAVAKGDSKPFESAIRNAALNTGKNWVGALRTRRLNEAAVARVKQLQDAVATAKDAELMRMRAEIERMRVALNSLKLAVGGFATDVDQLNIEVDGHGYSIEQINDDINVLRELTKRKNGKGFRTALSNARLCTGKDWTNGVKLDDLYSHAKDRVEQLKIAIDNANKDAEIKKLKAEIESMRSIKD